MSLKPTCSSDEPNTHLEQVQLLVAQKSILVANKNTKHALQGDAKIVLQARFFHVVQWLQGVNHCLLGKIKNLTKSMAASLNLLELGEELLARE